uniref:Uncharacterized protein n=1 Tax=Rhinolophus ferrumequinum TaxID=59479 RepID=A0A671F5C8_RHIFE
MAVAAVRWVTSKTTILKHLFPVPNGRNTILCVRNVILCHLKKCNLVLSRTLHSEIMFKNVFIYK